MALALVFPGQGSQTVGMGCQLAAAFPSARAVCEEVSDAIGGDLVKLMRDGPADQLALTENAQPALMAVSVAAIRALASVGCELKATAAYVAGHSLGEYSALTAAGVLSVGDAARLLRTRGRAMQQAVPVGQGTMVALIGLNIEQVRAIADKAAEGETCQAANDNAPGQVVVSGTTAAVARAARIAKSEGAKRVVTLPVSAPFHCALMKPAAEVMAEALARVELRVPEVPVVANVTAVATSDPEEIRALLVEQITAPVRWRESVLYMRGNGIRTLVECGAGKVLSALTRRIAPDMTAVAINDPGDVYAFASSAGLAV